MRVSGGWRLGKLGAEMKQESNGKVLQEVLKNQRVLDRDEESESGREEESGKC